MCASSRKCRRQELCHHCCLSTSQYLASHPDLDFPRLTVEDALEVVVGLSVPQVGADEFIVDLVLDVRKKNECGHHALATARLQLGRDLAIPHVVVVGQQSADGLGRHRQEQRAIMRQRLTARDPVSLAGIAQVLGVGLNVVEVVPGVVLALADGVRDAGVERVRGKGVTSTQTVSARPAFSVF